MEDSPGELSVGLFDMVLAFARALDLVHAEISDHHLRVAYVSCRVAEAMGLAPAEIRTALIAGALHDIGAASSPAGQPLLDHALDNYRIDEASLMEDIHRHGREGCELMRDFPPFAAAAAAVRFHHVPWGFGRGREFEGASVPTTAAILHLADRVAVLPGPQHGVLAQAPRVRAAIAADVGRRFMPEAVAAFAEVAAAEAFWLDMTGAHKEAILAGRFGGHEVGLDLDGLHALATMFGRVIDYRSPFTAAHSSGVAVVAEALGRRLGFSRTDATLLRIAGHLHDVGKLAVPPAILDKPGRLTEDEQAVIRQHPYHTFRILATVRGMETVATWAALHHERLDRRGYPFRAPEMPLGARVVAVADVFTAVTEDRPYRAGMGRAAAVGLLDRMVLDGAIDGDVVAVLRDEYDEFERIRRQSQSVACL